MSFARIELYIPKWVETLPAEHPVKEGLIAVTRKLLSAQGDAGFFETEGIRKFWELEFVSSATLLQPDPLQEEEGEDGKAQEENTAREENGIVRVRVEVDDSWYYQMLSDLAGVEIGGEYQLIAMVRELSSLKEGYERAREAMESVRATGYGVITPMQEEIRIEEPVLIRQGGKFGVKLKALSPSIHLLRADIETEISPIVGSQQQAEDLIAFIKESAKTEEGIWDTNIFGKTIEQMTEEGIQSKLSQITDESRGKLCQVMQRIVNESTGGFICIII